MKETIGYRYTTTDFTTLEFTFSDKTLSIYKVGDEVCNEIVLTNKDINMLYELFRYIKTDDKTIGGL